MKKKLTIVVRESGEKTLDACLSSIKEQSLDFEIHVIRESPFIKAVLKTFEIGLRAKSEYLLVVDADIILSENIISTILDKAQSLKKKWFCYDGYVFDYIFGRLRQGGPHLFNCQYLELAINALKEHSDYKRPESGVYRYLFNNHGIETFVDSKILGIHDFGQDNITYFRKGYQHAKKHSNGEYLREFIPNWSKRAEHDRSMEAVLRGFFHGLLDKRKLKLDINYLNKICEDNLTSERLIESKESKIEAGLELLNSGINRRLNSFWQSDKLNGKKGFLSNKWKNHLKFLIDKI